jgi:cytochrome c553
MKTKPPPPAYSRTKRDASFGEGGRDSYRSRRKPASPTVCPDCDAVFQDGRWQWAPAPVASLRGVCPACHRIRDDFPAGYVTLKGEFVGQHRAEVLQLVHNVEAREKDEHPMQRIMKIVDQGNGNASTVITTTDIHLARGIGDALHHAYRGKLDYHYSPQENLVRVLWERS